MMRLMAFLLLGLMASQVAAVGLFARVDRTQLSIDETFELSLESQGSAVFGKPDLQPLDELFEVFDTRQVNQLSSSNGEARAITRWSITLRPRQTGYVVIPPLQLGDWRSEPITLLVQESLKNTESDQLAPIFIDASVDQESVYVQAQVILTLRIFHSVSLYDDSTLSPLQMPEALVERLGEPRTYEKTINGIRHGVIEVRYALFPQKSGELTIPAQLFSATTVANGSNSLFGSRSGRSTQVRSPSIPLTVKAKPADYPANTPWLPARSLTLVEAWSPEPDQAQTGESLTRSLLLKAEGLTSTQLPAIGSAQSAGLRRYPDQPSLANEVSGVGLVGSREQREALIPTLSGTLQLPALEVVWWNTVEDRLERTTLDERTLNVADNPNLAPPPAELPAATSVPAEQQILWPWQLSTVLF
ncbi:MAG: protein BatD, partial [Pseudomonadales bacterium 32-61-5]